MADPITETFNLTADAARKFMKRQPRGTIFAVHLRFDAPIETSPGKCFPDGCMGILQVSRQQALKMPSNLLNKVLEDRGGRITVKRCVWASDSIHTKESRWIYIGG